MVAASIDVVLKINLQMQHLFDGISVVAISS
jgi:uncharacterized membrane-anchored protein